MKRPQQRFRCSVCALDELWEYEAEPVHCSKPMTPGDVEIPPGPRNAIHVVRLRRRPLVTWQVPGDPVEIFEIWKLGTVGRVNGERLGWIAEWTTTWEWRSTPGVKLQSGYSPDLVTAVRSLLIALEGGIRAQGRLDQVAERAMRLSVVS